MKAEMNVNEEVELSERASGVRMEVRASVYCVEAGSASAETE